MKIQFPSPELVGKWVWQDGPVLLNSRALGQSRALPSPLPSLSPQSTRLEATDAQ